MRQVQLKLAFCCLLLPYATPAKPLFSQATGNSTETLSWLDADLRYADTTVPLCLLLVKVNSVREFQLMD